MIPIPTYLMTDEELAQMLVRLWNIRKELGSDDRADESETAIKAELARRGVDPGFA